MYMPILKKDCCEFVTKKKNQVNKNVNNFNFNYLILGNNINIISNRKKVGVHMHMYAYKVESVVCRAFILKNLYF